MRFCVGSSLCTGGKCPEPAAAAAPSAAPSHCCITPLPPCTPPSCPRQSICDPSQPSQSFTGYDVELVRSAGGCCSRLPQRGHLCLQLVRAVRELRVLAARLNCMPNQLHAAQDLGLTEGQDYIFEVGAV